MNIYKLKYESQELAVSDLIEKGILTEDLKFSLPVHAVVPLVDGEFDLMIEDIVLENATFDEDGNELTPIVYKVFDFGINEIHPVTADHNFSGWELPNELILPNE